MTDNGRGVIIGSHSSVGWCTVGGHADNISTYQYQENIWYDMCSFKYTDDLWPQPTNYVCFVYIMKYPMICMHLIK